MLPSASYNSPTPVLITYMVLLDAPSFLSQQFSTILPRISLALRCFTPNSLAVWAVEIEPFSITYLWIFRSCSVIGSLSAAFRRFQCHGYYVEKSPCRQCASDKY